MGRRLLLPLCAVFLVYCLVVLARYASGYPELAPLTYFADFLLYVVLAKFIFILILFMSSFGYGRAVFGRWLPSFDTLLEEGLVKVFLGFIIISYAVFLAGLAHLLYPLTAYVLLAAGLGLGARDILDYVRRAAAVPREFKVTIPSVILISLSAFFLLKGLYGALLPPTGFDVLMYHLGVPRMYMDAHRIFPTPDIGGSYFPYGGEMLYLLAMLAEGAISANLVNFSFAVAGGLAAAAFARRFLGPRYGLLAFTLYVSVPMVLWLMPQAYVEFALAAYTMLAVHALFASFKEDDRGWFVAGAALAGFTAAIKYTGAVTIFVMLLVILFHYLAARKSGVKKAARYAGAFLLVCAAVSAAWYLRNVVYFGNPVYPFLMGVFGGGKTVYNGTSPFLTSSTGGPLAWLVSSFWRTTFNAQEFQMGWANGFGPYFLMFLPGIALFGRPPREVKYLLGFCLLSFLLLMPVGNIRYVLPLVPGLAVLAAYPAGRLLEDGSRLVRAAGTVFVAVFAFSALLANTGRDKLDGFPSGNAEAYEHYYSEEMMSGYLASYNTWKWINANLPSDAVIYQLWDDASVYFRGRKTLGSALPSGDTGRQRLHNISGSVGFGGYLPGEEIINNLKEMGAGYLLINANREGHAVPGDPYFQAHSRLVFQDKGVFLFQVLP